MATGSGYYHRRSIRLPGYDYARAGAYFVTICTHRRECLLGEVAGGGVALSPLGEAVRGCWEALPAHFPAVRLDGLVVMPNHVHGILFLDPAEGPGREDETVQTSPRQGAGEGEAFAGIGGSMPSGCDAAMTPRSALWPLRVPGDAPSGTAPGSLGAVVQSLKSVSARRANRLRRTPGLPLWQRNYHERVIRDEDELDRIRRYILDNPARWRLDPNHPDRARDP